MTEPENHKSVMVDEVIDELHIKNHSLFIDATLGTGGHALEILKHGGRVMGIDMDPEMLSRALERIKFEGKIDNFLGVIGNFGEIDLLARKNKWIPVCGIVMDLGVSNLHLKSSNRGFSFDNREAELDMRLNRKSQGVKASDLLNVLRRDQLTEMFMVTLKSGPSRWLTERLVKVRSNKSIQTVGDFLDICEGLKTGKSGLNQATLPFLALRIAVNGELDNLKLGLPRAYDLLEKEGKLIIITFHSGEDIIVKEFVTQMGRLGESKLITPTLREISINPRARSAKMRVIVKK